MEKSFTVLYTHQKNKKAKTWQDGFLKVYSGSKAVLYDDKCAKLESFFVSSSQVSVGCDLESDRHLITVEDCKQSGDSGKENRVNRPETSVKHLMLKTNCKRKRRGFVPPRKVKCVDEDQERPLSKAGTVDLTNNEIINTKVGGPVTAGGQRSLHHSPLFSCTGIVQDSLFDLYANSTNSKVVDELADTSKVISNDRTLAHCRDGVLTAYHHSDGLDMQDSSAENTSKEKRSASQILALIKSKKFPTSMSCSINGMQSTNIDMVRSVEPKTKSIVESWITTVENFSPLQCPLKSDSTNLEQGESKVGVYKEQSDIDLIKVAAHEPNPTEYEAKEFGVFDLRFSPFSNASDSLAGDLTSPDHVTGSKLSFGMSSHVASPNVVSESVHSVSGEIATSAKVINSTTACCMQNLEAMTKTLTESLDHETVKTPDKDISAPCDNDPKWLGLTDHSDGQSDSMFSDMDLSLYYSPKVTRHHSPSGSPHSSVFKPSSLPDYEDTLNDTMPQLFVRAQSENDTIAKKVNDPQINGITNTSVGHEVPFCTPNSSVCGSDTWMNGSTFSQDTMDLLDSQQLELNFRLPYAPCSKSLTQLGNDDNLERSESPFSGNPKDLPEVKFHSEQPFCKGLSYGQEIPYPCAKDLLVCDGVSSDSLGSKELDHLRRVSQSVLRGLQDRSSNDDEMEDCFFLPPLREERRGSYELLPSNANLPTNKIACIRSPSSRLVHRDGLFSHENRVTAQVTAQVTDVSSVITQVQRSLSSYQLKGSLSSQVAKRGSPLPNSTQAVKKLSQTTTRKSAGLCDLQFPPKVKIVNQQTPVRLMTIPTQFSSFQDYKHCLSSVVVEHLNIVLFELSKLLHSALDKVDISRYASTNTVLNSNPVCQHGLPSKVVQVKKPGANKDRYFYACAEPRQHQCKFFKWMDQAKSSYGNLQKSVVELSDASSIGGYLKGQGVPVYCECILVRRVFEKKWTSNKLAESAYHQDTAPKKSMYLKLTRKESSSTYSKDDLWIISHDLTFDFGRTFIARSGYYGPNSETEVLIKPVAGFSSSNWPDNSVCHAIHMGNTCSELMCLDTLQDLSPQALPLLPHLLSRNATTVRRPNCRFSTPAQSNPTYILHTTSDVIVTICEEYIYKYGLNCDQSEAVKRVASMLVNRGGSSVALIHGVFGAGKSFLLSVLVMFVYHVFQLEEQHGAPRQGKRILISSTTNVAVDRVLLGLLDLGFDCFIRVGSVRKIAKAILPYSVHASGSESHELKELQSMLKGDVTLAEKMYIRKAIEKQRLGENRQKLGSVQVVGVTCAACSFPCLKGIKFSMVLLDECSQMTEPASLLPLTVAECDKLVLIGDPRQLDPTIQGSEAGTDCGLEQTLFDRLQLMGHKSVMLRTQYRCHPSISVLANQLFYDNQLKDGVTEVDRLPVVKLPTLCFLDVSNGQEKFDSGSYCNDHESECVVTLIQYLLTSGIEPHDIGVITLYKAQAVKIQSQLSSAKHSDQKAMKSIQVSTVDAFQGGEKVIIILSCVRTDNVGFIDSDRRSNVALTRARNHLFIFGKKQNLCRNRLWNEVIGHCQSVPSGVQNAQVFLKAANCLLNSATFQ